MLNVHFFTFNAFQENTYLISNHKKECWIVDPGMYEQRETDGFISFIEKQGFTPQAIINTHAHLDHIFGVQAMVDKFHIPFNIHRLEQPVLDRGRETAAMFGFSFNNLPVVTNYIDHATPLQLGEDTVQVFLTPGHSPGSVSFYYEPGNWVIAGDVLFLGSIGRTDLPGGDFDTLISSIRTHLFTLPDNTTVLSGHGDSTTIGDEKRDNPFLR